MHSTAAVRDTLGRLEAGFADVKQKGLLSFEQQKMLATTSGDCITLLVELSQKADLMQAAAALIEAGAAGAVRELVALSRRSVSKNARVWVTGGGGAGLAERLGRGARYEPDLVLRGLDFLFGLNCR